MQCAEIRHKFVEYYQHLGFQWLPCAPMLHPSIPMSFVMSAGLVQVETSLANVKNRSGNKFLLIQDCFRHFDLDAIGTDNLHLSLFEMPAVFIFTKNGRRQIITQMWRFVTDIVRIEPERIWVSYFDGGEVAGHQLPRDELTYHVWHDVGISEHQLVGLGSAHNYWLQSGGFENGGSPWRKCGANTELFYDLGQNKSCSPDCQPGCRCGRFVEFSNLLFVSHHLHHDTNTLTPMDDPFTEAVIGTERVAMILQNASSVFDTWNYRSVIEKIHQFVTNTDVSPNLIQESERVIADHLRALYVLVAEGAPPPGKNGRERIIKLLIRGVITRQIILGIALEKRFFSEVFQLIVDVFVNESTIANNSPEHTISTYFEKENQRFTRTIDRGQRELEKMLKANGGQTLSGSQIVFLEKQYGMPYPLISVSLQKKGLPVLENEYNKALTAWKQKKLSN
jgi:alanyl-tRNA synthetase